MIDMSLFDWFIKNFVNILIFVFIVYLLFKSFQVFMKLELYKLERRKEFYNKYILGRK